MLQERELEAMRGRWHLTKMRDKKHADSGNSVSKGVIWEAQHIWIQGWEEHRRNKAEGGPKAHGAFMSLHCDLAWTPFPLLILGPLTSHSTDTVKSF